MLLPCKNATTCTSLTERVLEWQLTPGVYSGSDNASQDETQRAWPPWPPLPYLWNEFWGDNLWFLSALRFNIQWSKLVCITDIFFSLIDEFAQMREQWVVKELMLKANMFLLPVGTLLMEVKLGQILLPTPLFPLCMTLLWTSPMS